MIGTIAKVIQTIIPRGKYLVLKRKFQELKKKRYSPISEEAFRNILLKQFLIKRGDVVFVHSAVGDLNIDFEPTKLLDIIIDVIGAEGTVLFPAWHFLNRAEDYYAENPPIFNVKKTRSKLGFLTEWARMNKQSKRSLHPTNSIVAIGKDAEYFVADHQLAKYPCGDKSPFYKLIGAKAKIIGLGVDVNNLTFLHCIEDVEPELFNIKTRTDQVHKIEVLDDQGKKIVVKTVLADKEIGKRDPILFFNRFIKNDKCLRLRISGSNFFMVNADVLHEELRYQAEKGNTIYSVVN